MRTSLRQRFFLMFALLACASISVAVFAQSTLEGGIGGIVTDQSKAVVPNAKVTAVNLGTNQESTTVSDDSGRFRLAGLRPGTYAVTVAATNFAPYKAQSVTVEVGLVTNLEVALAIAGKSEVVEVRSEAPTINTTAHDFTANINETAINDLPINGRRWSEYAKLTPGAVPDGNYGLMSFRGISGLLNNSTIDGGDNNQAFFSEERGRTRLNYAISQAAIREFQVNTSNFSAEYGRAAGAVVNAVTKSGTNELHGTAFYYNRDNNYGARNAFSYINTLVNGQAQLIPLKPKDKRHQFGGTFGGPLIKDKMFFFFSYDQQKRNFPGVAGTASPTFLNPITVAAPSGTQTCSSTGLSAGNVLSCRGVTQAQTDASLAYLRSLTGVVPRKGDQLMFLPKLDWRINDNHTMTFTYNRSRWKSPAGVQTQATVTRAIDAWGDDFVDIDTMTARLSSAVSSNVSNELRYQYSRDFEHQNSQKPAPGTPLTSPDGGAPDINVAYSNGGFNIGRPNFLERAAYPDEHRNQVTDNMSVAHGKHLTKFGIDYNHVNDLMSNLYQGGGSYSYSTLADWVSDYSAWAASPTSPAKLCTYTPRGGTPMSVGCYGSFYQAFGPMSFRFATDDIDAYLNDEWRAAARLTLNFGLRYEYEKLPSPQIPNALLPDSTRFHPDKNNFGPRMGFAYDLFGTGKSVLRGGYGIYYGRIINATIYNAITSTGLKQGQVSYSYYNNTTGAPLYPNTVKTAPTTSIKPNVVTLDSTFANPMIHQVDLVFEQEIAHNTVFSLSYLMSKGGSLPLPIDLNLNAPTATITYNIEDGPFAGQDFTVPMFTGSRPNASFGTMVDVKPAGRSRYDAMVVQINRRMTNGLQIMTNYTWSHALDNNPSTVPNPTSPSTLNPFDLQGEWGNSGFDARHKFAFTMVYSPTFKVTNHLLDKVVNGFSIAPIYQYSTGRAYTPGVSGNIASKWLPAGVTTTAGGLEANGGDYRLPIQGRNSCRYPEFENLDMRVSRRFRLTERTNLELLAEGFNLFNHVNPTSVNTGMYTIDSSPAVPSMKFNSTFGIPTQASSTLWRERQLQFAARISF